MLFLELTTRLSHSTARLDTASTTLRAQRTCLSQTLFIRSETPQQELPGIGTRHWGPHCRQRGWVFILLKRRHGARGAFTLHMLCCLRCVFVQFHMHEAA